MTAAPASISRLLEAVPDLVLGHSHAPPIQGRTLLSMMMRNMNISLDRLLRCRPLLLHTQLSLLPTLLATTVLTITAVVRRNLVIKPLYKSLSWHG